MATMKRKVPYLEIAEDLRRKIRKEKLAPGTPVMSSRALAHSYGVSLSTAHKAILQLVNEETLYRLRGSGTYVKSREESRLRQPVIGCVIGNRQENERLAKLLDMPENLTVEFLRAHHCKLKFISPQTFSCTINYKEYLEGLDGLLVSATAVRFSTCHRLCTLKIPTVLFQGEFEHDLPFHQILPDQMSGLREMFQAALEWKFKGISILHHAHPNGLFRKDTCIKAAAEVGYENIEDILLTTNENIYKLGLKFAKNCKDKLIFTTSDLITFDLINAFNDCGLHPSVDYHIVGFDNIEGLNIRPYAIPTATAIYYNREKAAAIAGKLLLSEIRQPSGVSHIIKIPTEFILRESGLNNKGTNL